MFSHGHQGTRCKLSCPVFPKSRFPDTPGPVFKLFTGFGHLSQAPKLGTPLLPCPNPESCLLSLSRAPGAEGAGRQMQSMRFRREKADVRLGLHGHSRGWATKG